MSECYLHGQNGGSGGGETVLLETLTMRGTTQTKTYDSSYDGSDYYKYTTGFAKGQTLTYTHKGITAVRFDYKSNYSRAGAALWIPKIGCYNRLVDDHGSPSMRNLAWQDSTASTIYLKPRDKAASNTIYFPICNNTDGFLSVSISGDTLTVKADYYTYNANTSIYDNDYPTAPVLTVYVYGTK